MRMERPAFGLIRTVGGEVAIYTAIHAQPFAEAFPLLISRNPVASCGEVHGGRAIVSGVGCGGMGRSCRGGLDGRWRRGGHVRGAGWAVVFSPLLAAAGIELIVLFLAGTNEPGVVFRNLQNSGEGVL